MALLLIVWVCFYRHSIIMVEMADLRCLDIILNIIIKKCYDNIGRHIDTISSLLGILNAHVFFFSTSIFCNFCQPLTDTFNFKRIKLFVKVCPYFVRVRLKVWEETISHKQSCIGKFVKWEGNSNNVLVYFFIIMNTGDLYIK